MTKGRVAVRPVAFVQACWHRELVDGCRDAFLAEMAELEPDRGVQVFEVPGSFELPLHAHLLARSGRYDAVVAAGLVVDGGIYRHEFVAQAVINGLMQVQLDAEVPVLSVVLTPQTFHDHDDHRSFFAKHLAGKGREAARACATTCASLALLDDAIVPRPAVTITAAELAMLRSPEVGAAIKQALDPTARRRGRSLPTPPGVLAE